MSARSAATRPGLAPRTMPTTPVLREDAVFDAERVEFRSNQRRGFVLLESEFGTAVDRAAQLDHAIDHGLAR